MATEKESSLFFKLNAYFAQLVEDIIDVPASVILGQSYLESGAGKSQLASEYNNLFGIKGKGDQGSVTLKSDEYINGELVKDVPSDFARYSSTLESFKDYGSFLQRNPRYKEVFGLDAYQTIDAIAGAGYATDPNYSTKVKGIIDKYDLTQYDGGADVGNMIVSLPFSDQPETVVESVFGNPLEGEGWEDRAYERHEALNPKPDIEGFIDDLTPNLNPFKGMATGITKGIIIVVIIVVLLVIIIQALPIPQVQAAKQLMKGGAAS